MPSTSSFYNIINDVYDSASNSLRMSLNFTHTHSSGSGGQLDWDVVWSDAVHSHGTNTEGGQLDHGLSMTTASLADDDHPAYVPKSTVTLNGDLIVANGSASVTRLAAGSANYVLTSTGIGSQASWQNITAAITSGSYTGDAGTNRAIAHSLGKIPKHIRIRGKEGTARGDILEGTIYAFAANNAGVSPVVPTLWDTTSFYVGTVQVGNSFNDNGSNYSWVAFG